MRRRVIVVLIAAVLTSLTVRADVQTVNNCRVIDQPGSYRLQKVITASANDLVPIRFIEASLACIVIEASFVTLDLHGYAIVGPGTISDEVEVYGIATERTTGVVIRNGSVTNFNTGVRIMGSEHTVEHMRLLRNTRHGIEGAESGRILSNTASENGDVGIFGLGSYQVVGNVANGNRGTGIHVDASPVTGRPGPRIVGNVANGNGAFGISASCSALLLQNMASGNGIGQIVTRGAPLVECVRADNNPLP